MSIETRAEAQGAAPEAAAATDTGARQTPSSAQQGFSVYDTTLLGLVLIWAANPAAIKWALNYIDPLVFNAFRFVLAALVLTAMVYAGRDVFRWERGDGWKLLGLGLFGHGLYQLLFILSIDNTLAGNAALILSINPVFVAVFGAAFGYEQIRRHTWLGIGLTLLGVGLVISGSDRPLEFGSRLLGDLLMLAASILWALYTVLTQPFLKKYSAVKVNAMTMPVGALVLVLAAIPTATETAAEWTAAPPLAWVILALSGALAVSLAYVIWSKGVQKLGAVRTAVYANLVPVLAAVFSFTILKEELGWQFWVGMVIVVAGVSLARFGGKR